MEENGETAQKEIDKREGVWYAEYVGAITGIALICTHFAAAVRLFVNFTMETF